MQKTLTLLSIVFLAVGVLLVLGAILLAFDTRRFLDQAHRATGEVASIEEHESSDGVLMYTPVIRFRTSSGQDIVFRSSTASNVPDYVVGQKLEVAYGGSGARPNGRNPWRIVAQWKNPTTGALHVFQSNDLWFDPTPHLSSQPIAVFLDPRNPKRYYMDVSFLPKLAD